jgi:hypothetical protein
LSECEDNGEDFLKKFSNSKTSECFNDIINNIIKNTKIDIKENKRIDNKDEIIEEKIDNNVTKDEKIDNKE